VATDWYTLGLQLDIEDEELRVVDSKENTAAECFRKTLREWLRTSTPTHDAIITALSSSSVGHKALATRLDSKGSFMLHEYATLSFRFSQMHLQPISLANEIKLISRVI